MTGLTETVVNSVGVFLAPVPRPVPQKCTYAPFARFQVAALTRARVRKPDRFHSNDRKHNSR